MAVITRQNIRDYAGELVALLESEKINSAAGLQKVAGRAHTIGTDRAYVEVSERPSNAGTTALTLSYILPGSGIPIEARVNEHQRYSKLIIKLNDEVEGYSVFMTDSQINMMQERNFAPGGFEEVRDELKRLAG